MVDSRFCGKNRPVMLEPLKELDNGECLTTQQRHSLKERRRRSDLQQLMIYDRSQKAK